jgi:hypothetical protein
VPHPKNFCRLPTLAQPGCFVAISKHLKLPLFRLSKKNLAFPEPHF